MSLVIPYIMSWFIGFLLVHFLLKQEEDINLEFRLFLSLGIGMGVSGYISFFSFLIFNTFHRPFILVINLIVLGILAFLCYKDRTSFAKLSVTWQRSDLISLTFLGLLFLFLIPITSEAKLFPMGGWDAWSVWNLKSRFLFLGGDSWQNMLDPILWRSSPHYPFLLPLMNVWGWIFSQSPIYVIPMVNSIIFTFLTVGFLYSSLKSFTTPAIAFLAALVMVTLPTFNSLGTNQYSDVILSFYLLGSLCCLLFAIERKKSSYAILAGICTGLLMFTKTEGTIAGMLIALFVAYYCVMQKTQKTSVRLGMTFFVTLFIASLPTIIFKLFYAPANITFINGLFSQTHPATFLRLKLISGFFFFALGSEKWHSVWIILLIGIILSKGKCFKGTILIFPLFLYFYGLIVGFYYWINTYFEILWFLTTTMTRIMFTVLPITIFWVFYSVWRDQNKFQAPNSIIQKISKLQ